MNRETRVLISLGLALGAVLVFTGEVLFGLILIGVILAYLFNNPNDFAT